jgi:thiol-disulfide isomerase/thioredoxin
MGWHANVPAFHFVAREIVMKTRRQGILLYAALAAAGLSLAGCGRGDAASQARKEPAPAAQAAVDLKAVHADAPGIAWYEGDVDAAFAAAKASNKPVLLYWGAQWCPPCKQLKSAVFSRPDFIEKSKLFVSVYLDGDLPDAQKWGDVFRVSGYPTVVVLKNDRTEITRIAGNMDLSLYAGVLDNVLGDVKPVKAVVDLAVKGEAPLAVDDCRRLAYHAFGLEDDDMFAAGTRQTAFENAARLCPESLTKERARFQIRAAAEASGAQKDALEKGGKPDTRLKVLVVRVNDILANRELALANADELRGLRKPFFLAVRSGLPQIAAQVRERWMAVADAAAVNPNFAPADQLAAHTMRITAAKAYAPDDKAPTDVRSTAVAAAAKMLAVKQEAYVRAGVVNSAVNIYIALDDWPRARDLLAQEAQTSNTPHYYIGDLAYVEEKLGNNDRAVELLAEAYDKARGAASRFQWGYDYLSGLMRLKPDDVARIEKVGLAVLAELDGPNRVHRRTRGRLDRLDKALDEWNTAPARAGVVAKFRSSVLTACAKSPGDQVVAASCEAFGLAS